MVLPVVAHYSWNLSIAAFDGVSWKYLRKSGRRRAQRVLGSSTPGCRGVEKQKAFRWEVEAWAEEVLLVIGATHEIYLARVRDAAGHRMVAGAPEAVRV